MQTEKFSEFLKVLSEYGLAVHEVLDDPGPDTIEAFGETEKIVLRIFCETLAEIAAAREAVGVNDERHTLAECIEGLRAQLTDAQDELARAVRERDVAQCQVLP